LKELINIDPLAIPCWPTKKIFRITQGQVAKKGIKGIKGRAESSSYSGKKLQV
jgi:hypothetical protein